MPERGSAYKVIPAIFVFIRFREQNQKLRLRFMRGVPISLPSALLMSAGRYLSLAIAAIAFQLLTTDVLALV
ncbi:hypothetical protein SAMN05216228_102022 [Rhizobium tibeticum]|uniref:Uncharacterized protein n=1 Tax=Rhizobium tibeticum TaxID=501024 RepID=A0A1H8QXR8_9HYPH|nr:hypothetical protein [Rhizobium tibeticum]SEI06207.1 hypothetical protein RTCCBAU85039_4117 [Rhizobium tibeticum]SEO58791.1 hypothetical protein SAMN05216228_102022 [Rhizobium tibeticum]